MRIDIHIGIEKTGTTAVQGYLAQSRPQLLKQGILFPASLGRRFSGDLVAACQTREKLDDLRRVRRLHDRVAVDQYREQLAHDLAQEITREQPQRLLLSCEHFSSRLQSSEELGLLGEFLRRFSSDVRVLVYLRRQDDWFISAYSTAVTSGRTRPFRYPNPGDEREVLHYDRLLQRWEAEFGLEAMTVRRYPGAGNDVVSDFCQALALPETVAPVHTNTALNENLLDLLRALNDKLPVFGPDGAPNPDRGQLVRALAACDLQGTPFNGTGEEREFYRRFEAGNAEVARRYFSQDMLFSEPVPRRPESATPLDSSATVEVMAHLWRYQQRQQELSRERELQNLLMLQIARGQVAAARDTALAVDAEFPGSCDRLQSQTEDSAVLAFLGEKVNRRS